MIWIFWLLTSLIFLPLCLDWQLVPRFFALSLFIGVSVILRWKDLLLHADWRLSVLDIALLGWFLLNTAGIFWAFSWSEAVFYAQKTGLFFCVHWLIRQALLRDEADILPTFQRATSALTIIAILVTGYEISSVALQHGLANQNLYDNIRILYGNKSLTTDFLFFLLIFNGLTLLDKATSIHSANSNTPSHPVSHRAKWLTAGLMAVLLLLIILLQTRTVYLAVAGAGGLLLTLSLWRPGHFLRQKKWVLPAAGLLLAGALFLIARSGGTLAERLNPMTYLDSDTAIERRFVWYKTGQLCQENYWWGVGNGSWKIRWPEQSMQGGYRMEQLQVAFTRAHNDYLEIRAELGIIGAILFCGLFVLVAVAGLWSWRKSTQEQVPHPALPLLLAGIFGYCIIQYFDFPRERIELQVALALLFAFTAHYSRNFWFKMPGFLLKNAAKPIFLTFLSLNALWGLVIGWHRISGEIHNIRLLQAVAQRDNLAVIRESKAAINPFYEYDDVTLPLLCYQGNAYMELKQSKKALEAFKHAIALNPWSYQTLNNYATVIVSTAQPGDTASLRKAIPLLQEAVRINPRHYDGTLKLAYTYGKLGESEKALAWIEKTDTIRNPANENDRKYNQFVQQEKQRYREMITVDR